MANRLDSLMCDDCARTRCPELTHAGRTSHTQVWRAAECLHRVDVNVTFDPLHHLWMVGKDCHSFWHSLSPAPTPSSCLLIPSLTFVACRLSAYLGLAL